MTVRVFSAPVLALVLLLAPLLSAKTPGIFRGIMVKGPRSEPGWIYLLGRNGAVRRVEVSRARISYSQSVPQSDRALKPEASLREGAELRITAEQDSDGEWRATEIEILNLKAPLEIEPASYEDRVPMRRS